MRVHVEMSIWNEADALSPSRPFRCAIIGGCSCACGGYKEEIFTVSWVKELERELRKMPGMAGEGGRLSSGVLAGGVGILIIAAVKSRSSQFSFRSSVRAFRLERLCGLIVVLCTCSVSSSWTLPRLTDTVELARRMALLLALRGQQDVETPCWLEMEVLRLVR